MSSVIAIHGASNKVEARMTVMRTTARPVPRRPMSAMQRKSPDERSEKPWFGGSGSRPTSAGVQRGRIRPHSALARVHASATSSDDDLDDTYSVASTRASKLSRAGSPTIYSSRPLSAMSRPSSAMSRATDVDTLHEGDECPTPEQSRGITRRFYTGGLTGGDGKKMSHFTVRMPAPEETGRGKPSSDKTAYLSIYYSDLLGAAPAVEPVGPNQRTIEVERMANWLTEAAPRSRVDAYPLLVLTRDILKRFVSKDLKIVSTEAKRLTISLDLTNKALQQTQTDLAKAIAQSITEITARDDMIRELNGIADKLPDVEAELLASNTKFKNCEAKIADLVKKAEERKDLFTKKLEETKKAIMEKAEAANEKRLEAAKSQVSDYQRKLEASKDEIKKAKAELAAAQKNLLREKEFFDKQLKENGERSLLTDEVLAGLEKLDFEGTIKIFKYLMTSPAGEGCAGTEGSFLEQLHAIHKDQSPALFQMHSASHPTSSDVIHDGAAQTPAQPEAYTPEEPETITPLLHMMQTYGLYSDGRLNARAYSELNYQVRWNLCVAVMVDHVYQEPSHAPCNPLDAILIATLQMAVGHAQVMNLAGVHRASEEEPQMKLHLERANHEVVQLTNQNQKLKETIIDLELEIAHLKPNAVPVVVVEVAVVAAPPKVEAAKVEDWSKLNRPRALCVFKMDPKAFKGKTPQAARVDQMLQMFSNIYESKAHADLVDDREGNTRQSYPEFLRDWMINKFGLKSIALSNLASLIMGIQVKSCDKDAGSRIRVFGHMSGIIPHACWHEDLSNLILFALGLLFQIPKISENMGHASTKKPLIEASLAIEATHQAWTKYGFGNLPFMLDDSMIQMSRREGGQVRLHEWLELLSDTWLATADAMEKDLRSIFVKHDDNGDGVLDLAEFRTMIAALLGESGDSMDERQVSRLFAECLEESASMKVDGGGDEDEDVMQPEAFVRVARRARLYNAPS